LALRIRLTRLGAKKRPFYRIVVIDSRRARGGEYLDLIGNYDPLKSPAEIKINTEKAISWMHKGAIPSDTVMQMLSKQGVSKQGEMASTEVMASKEVIASTEAIASKEVI
jgi:small subunit ribosomal protein S16